MDLGFLLCITDTFSVHLLQEVIAFNGNFIVVAGGM